MKPSRQSPQSPSSALRRHVKRKAKLESAGLRRSATALGFAVLCVFACSSESGAPAATAGAAGTVAGSAGSHAGLAGSPSSAGASGQSVGGAGGARPSVGGQAGSDGPTETAGQGGQAESGGGGQGGTGGAEEMGGHAGSAGDGATAGKGGQGPVKPGKWTTGDLHVHTTQSNDANSPDSTLAGVLDKAFQTNDLDWVALSNHLRLSDRDPEHMALAGGPIPFSKALALYEVPAVLALQKAGKYAGKTIFSSVEWDMPTHEHFNIGILGSAPGSAESLKALNQFEYLFTNRDPNLFNAEDVTSWGTQRWNATHADALQALTWLKQHYPDSSYGLINHPSRNPGKYKAADYREFNDLAPNLVFAIEGMLGNQMEPDRGGYVSAYIEANAKSRAYGGTDYVVAKLGGLWDSLLGEGRRVWNFGNSDFHFKTAQGKFSSGYYPGEYCTNYIWVDGEGMPAILKGMRAGKAFSVFGNLISALEFELSAASVGPEDTGGELVVAKNTEVQIRIRFKSALPSNYEARVGGRSPGKIPVVDHIDLIAGDVTQKAQPGTADYDSATNASTHVVKRFSAVDWTTDAAGYQVLSYKVVAKKGQYFRLRGTNLGPDVANETQNGEPLADAKIDIADDKARFNAINDRNYADLWFYSNPIFLKVE